MKRIYEDPLRHVELSTMPPYAPRYHAAIMKLATALLLLPAALRQCMAYTTLSDASLQALPFPGADFDMHTGALLAPILRPRVPGTPGSEAVLQHFVDFFRNHLPDWRITIQNSSSTTPTSHGKEIPFRNLIATRDPPWLDGKEGEVGRLALGAHYDSKLTPTGFIGATDSAAPCAMLLHVARSIDAALTKKWAAMEAEGFGSGGFDGVEEHQGVQILLLDGEEAFETWTHTDSVYGARALAEEWESTMNPAMSTFRTPLESMELFLLLDLLGAANPTVPSYFKTTHWAYQHMATDEQRLRALKKLKSSPSHPFLTEAGKKESDSWIGGFIEDDHLPFMTRGVEILHIIASPFPHVWHRMEDDGEHLDLPTTEDWAVITTAFAAEWLDLEGHLDAQAKESKEGKKRKRDEGKTEL
jgi:glutaminyl-peptide cyclotransferase